MAHHASITQPRIAFLAVACLASLAGAVRGADDLATEHLTPGWATFGQVLPRGVARDGLALGALRTQVDVKNRWQDGSIRFAIVTAAVAAEGDYPLRAASPA